ncbi:HI1506-related protein [Achromobacter insuavis]|uniref:HI1506-related protein n=1 Tax=Achromobacter insuavis TaxID=1287735 RepID=UPI001F140ECD|nr:HI1506-related protein [Achromobacter insuavis]
MATAKPRGRQATAKPAVVKPDGAKALKVVPKVDGFRRAGRAFAGQTVIPLSELTDEQYEQLTTEPQLVTMLIDLPGEPGEANQAGAT